VVIVATAKAVAYHGGSKEDGGLANLAKHIENVRHFGREPVVALNRFDDDRVEDLERIIQFCSRHGVEAVIAEHFRKGGAGAIELAQAVLRSIEKNRRRKFRFQYELSHSLDRKLGVLAGKLYGADGVDYDRSAETDLELLERYGFGSLPVCVAKAATSLSDDASRRGRPRAFRVTVNELRLSAGAGFVVAICGNIVTMPGLPKVPAAARIRVLPDGRATGLS
jgi:formate--tetrahydrofolate ligase